MSIINKLNTIFYIHWSFYKQSVRISDSSINIRLLININKLSGIQRHNPIDIPDPIRPDQRVCLVEQRQHRDPDPVQHRVRGQQPRAAGHLELRSLHHAQPALQTGRRQRHQPRPGRTHLLRRRAPHPQPQQH